MKVGWNEIQLGYSEKGSILYSTLIDKVKRIMKYNMGTSNMEIISPIMRSKVTIDRVFIWHKLLQINNYVDATQVEDCLDNVPNFSIIQFVFSTSCKQENDVILGKCVKMCENYQF